MQWHCQLINCHNSQSNITYQVLYKLNKLTRKLENNQLIKIINGMFIQKWDKLKIFMIDEV